MPDRENFTTSMLCTKTSEADDNLLSFHEGTRPKGRDPEAMALCTSTYSCQGYKLSRLAIT